MFHSITFTTNARIKWFRICGFLNQNCTKLKVLFEFWVSFTFNSLVCTMYFACTWAIHYQCIFISNAARYMQVETNIRIFHITDFQHAIFKSTIFFLFCSSTNSKVTLTEAFRSWCGLFAMNYHKML